MSNDPVDGGECLRGLLAGRDDAEDIPEMYGNTIGARWWRVLRDAARAVHG